MAWEAQQVPTAPSPHAVCEKSWAWSPGFSCKVEKLCSPIGAHAAEKLAAVRLLDVTSCLCAWTELRAQGEGQGEGGALLVGIAIVRGGKILED